MKEMRLTQHQADGAWSVTRVSGCDLRLMCVPQIQLVSAALVMENVMFSAGGDFFENCLANFFLE